MMRLLRALTLVHVSLAFVATQRRAPRVRHSRSLRRARPEDCPEAVWERIVEAEAASREKKFGAVGASLANFGLDKDKIEENRLRIWEELKAKQASGEKPRRREDAAAEEVQKAPGPFAGLRKAWDDVYKEADAMGYAQAVALNAKLEKKGILPEVMPRGDSPLGLDPANDAPKKSQAKRRKKGKGGKPKAKRGAGFS